MHVVKLKHIYTLLMIVFVFFAFVKPLHFHGNQLIKSQGTHTAAHEENHSHHSADCTTDCNGSDCACPLHRVNGCSPLTALTKTERFVVLDITFTNSIENLFSAKPSPLLDGPFQPPRV